MTSLAASPPSAPYDQRVVSCSKERRVFFFFFFFMIPGKLPWNWRIPLVLFDTRQNPLLTGEFQSFVEKAESLENKPHFHVLQLKNAESLEQNTSFSLALPPLYLEKKSRLHGLTPHGNFHQKRAGSHEPKAETEKCRWTGHRSSGGSPPKVETTPGVSGSDSSWGQNPFLCLSNDQVLKGQKETPDACV